MNKIKVLCSILALSLCLSACGKPAETVKPENTQTPAVEESKTEYPDTLGGKYLEVFEKSKTEKADAAADELIKVESGYDLVKMDVKPGYLDGFDNDIKGFTKGVKFSPMIGSIPFVGYVFETENADALLKELNGCANKAWNICTMADETVSSVRGGMVLFLMCPNEG